MRGGGESGAAGGSSASDGEAGAAPAVGADGVLKYFKSSALFYSSGPNLGLIFRVSRNLYQLVFDQEM